MNNNATTNAKDFDMEHGDDGIMIDGWLCFSDGAYREINPMGVRCVATESYKKAKLIVRYWQAKLNLAVEEFTVFKSNLMSFTRACSSRRNCYPPPDSGAIKKLKSIKAKVQSLKLQLEKAEENLVNNKPADMVKREKVDTELRQKCEHIYGEIQSIEI